jgi:hypothetical protein
VTPGRGCRALALVFVVPLLFLALAGAVDVSAPAAVIWSLFSAIQLAGLVAVGFVVIRLVRHHRAARALELGPPAATWVERNGAYWAEYALVGDQVVLWQEGCET